MSNPLPLPALILDPSLSGNLPVLGGVSFSTPTDTPAVRVQQPLSMEQGFPRTHTLPGTGAESPLQATPGPFFLTLPGK